jgi:hypothetical protein
MFSDNIFVTDRKKTVTNVKVSVVLANLERGLLPSSGVFCIAFAPFPPYQKHPRSKEESGVIDADLWS